jgi:hypothetical protein
MHNRQHHDVRNAFFLLEGVQVSNQEELEVLATQIHGAGATPKLIVLDTLARCFVGGEENSAKEMGEFVNGVGWLQRQTGATVIVLHHTGKQEKEIERGSTALRAGFDVMIHVSMDTQRLITIGNNKQKDDEEFQNITLQLNQVVVDADACPPTTSCVLVPRGKASANDHALPFHLRQTLAAMCSEGRKSLPLRRCLEVCGEPERTLHSHVDLLVTAGYVEKVKRGVYKVTEKGWAAFETAATATTLHLVKHGS